MPARGTLPLAHPRKEMPAAPKGQPVALLPPTYVTPSSGPPSISHRAEEYKYQYGLCPLTLSPIPAPTYWKACHQVLRSNRPK